MKKRLSIVMLLVTALVFVSLYSIIQKTKPTLYSPMMEKPKNSLTSSLTSIV